MKTNRSVLSTAIVSRLTRDLKHKNASKSARTIFALLSLTATLAFTSCQKSEPGSANLNSAPSSTTASNNSATPSMATSTPAVAASPEPTQDATASLTTPTEAYKAGYAARKNKDIALLKRVLSKDALEFLTEIAQLDEKTLDDQLKQLADHPQADSDETRNEKINGNRASLEYLDEKGKWNLMEFSKEGTEWKIDLPKGP